MHEYATNIHFFIQTDDLNYFFRAHQSKIQSIG